MENNFATNFKHLRLQNGFTQEEIAKKLNKDYSTIGKWENGTRSPIMEDVIKIADLFNVSMQTLIGENVASNSGEYELEQEIYFNKFKDLSPRDREIVKGVIDSIIKEIDEKDK